MINRKTGVCFLFFVIAFAVYCSNRIYRDGLERGGFGSDDIRNNCRDIYIGLSVEFEVRNGHLGSAIVGDKQEPLYSWRVPVAARLTEEGFATRFSARQPWNSDENSFLLDYKTSLMYGYNDSVYAHIVALSGENTAFNSGSLLNNVPPNAILLIEFRKSRFRWFEPGDLTINDFLLSPGTLVTHVLGDGNFFVVFGDGHVIEMDGHIPLSEFLPFCDIRTAGTASRRDLEEKWKVR